MARNKKTSNMFENTESDFKFILKDLRQEKNISQNELAKELNISVSTVGMWENGRNHPNINTLINLARIFNVSVNYLLGICDDERLLKIPVYSQPVNLLNELHPVKNLEFIHYKPHEEGAKYVGLKINKLYKENFLYNGDVVIIKRTSVFGDGDYVALTYFNKCTVIKKANFSGKGFILSDISGQDAPEYYNFSELNKNNIGIVGVVEEIHRAFK